MKFFSFDYPSIAKDTIRLLRPRKGLPNLLLTVGVGMVALFLGMDFIGLGYPGFSSKQIMGALAGAGIFVGGIILGLSSGERTLRSLLFSAFPDQLTLIKFLATGVQLTLLYLVIERFHLGNQALSQNIMPLTVLGFLFHYFLPHRYRLPFFLLLSMTGILVVFGLNHGIQLIAIGLALIGICHLPIPFSGRIVTLLVIGAFLALSRVDWIHAPWPSSIWPLLGSMFMFRLIIYLYDFRHTKEGKNLPTVLSYFFLLPNIVFPFFPVIDYKTFCRTYYDAEQFEIYQKGLNWMLRGVTHLLLYRIVYYYLSISPEDVVNIGSLIRYLISTYLLYLRVSGLFHLVIGMLHLFGFNLPETHHLYYLASSFTDFWRRTNIYWKDFMQKIFFYPAFFRLRIYGTTLSLVLSTLFVFFMTWILHSYQWFWLRGSFLFSGPDVLFWMILAFLVVGNSLYEIKHGRERALRKHQLNFIRSFSLTLRTIGTFASICMLWSFWSSASISEWFSLWSFARNGSLSIAGLISIASTTVVGLFISAMIIRLYSRLKAQGDKGSGVERKYLSISKSAFKTGSFLVLLYLFATPTIYSSLGSKAQDVIRDIRVPRLNTRDAAIYRRGYYEELNNADRFNAELWEIYSERQKSWRTVHQTEAGRITGDYYAVELVPSTRILFYGEPYTVNRWGMRDQDYALIPPPKTFRIALIGASHANGWGVADDETFENLLEERLNHQNTGRLYARYEILNFAVGHYPTVRQLMVLERKVFPFRPHAVFFVAVPADMDNVIRSLQWAVTNRIEIPYELLREIVRQSGANPDASYAENKRMLKPFRQKIISWAYQRMVKECRSRNIVPVWILLPTSVREKESDLRSSVLLRLANDAGFIALNLMNVYDQHNPKSLQPSEWDSVHPNAKGHRLIAERLFESLKEQKDKIPLGFFDQPPDKS